MNQDLVPQPTSTAAALNVLFVGETNIGENSIIDLVTGSGEQKKVPHHAGRDDVRSITLDGKVFILHASPTNESMSTAAAGHRIQDTLTDLHRNGGVHLLVYCVNASHSIKCIHEIHRTIIPSSTPSSHVPTVAVVAGISDVAQQESWWSSNEDAFAEQGPRFDHHVFIPTMTTGTQSPSEDYVSDSRHILHELILQNHAHAFNSETDSNSQRTAPYKHRSIGNSFQSLLVSGKPPPHTSTGSKDVDIVLLGETGVGKSSLVNLIARKNIAEVSSDTVGCTKTIVKYTFEEKGRTFHLYDTPGLVDPLMDIERFVAPIDTIQKLIRNLGNGNGPDLLLFCIDKPTFALKRNYRLFCKIICGGEVSFALAITKLGECQDLDEWWGRHGDTIRKYGIDRSKCIALGRGKGHSGPASDLEGLRESLLSFFVARADRPKNRTTSLRSMIVSVTAFIRAQISTPEKILMNECELEERTAQELINRMTSSRASYNDGVHT